LVVSFQGEAVETGEMANQPLGCTKILGSRFLEVSTLSCPTFRLLGN
jgi:hypothetical protein